MLQAYEDYYKYFRFMNDTYTEGTIVKFKNNFCNTHTYKNKPIWPYARFSHKVIHDNILYYIFNICNLGPGWNRYAGYCLLTEMQLEYAIEEIIESVPILIVDKEYYKDWEVEGMGWLWLIYIVVLFFSMIFKEFYLIWMVASYIFFTTRKKMLLK